jgi:integrase
MDLTEAIEEFMADLKLAGRALRTVEGHELELKRLQRWLEAEGLGWQELTRRQLQQYARLRADKGHSSRSNMFCSLRTFYRWAVEAGYVALSPAAGFKTPKKPKPLPRSLTLDQVRVLITYLREGQGRRARRDEAMLLTALYTGFRAKELAMLRWSMLDLRGGSINIPLSKMGKGRAIKLHPTLCGVLERWFQIQGLDRSAPIFSLDGKPIKPNRVGKVARRIARETGLPLTAHVLRHTFATWSYRRSRDIYAVSKALGHSELKQTEIYVESDPEDSGPAVDSLPDLESW